MSYGLKILPEEYFANLSPALVDENFICKLLVGYTKDMVTFNTLANILLL
jgi:hypothetical protein